MTTYIYLDTEFNGFGGELISLALVEPISGKTFYRVKQIPMAPHPWVAEHVLPLITVQPVGDALFRGDLWAFMLQFPDAVIVADWPEDFAHFTAHMCAANGTAPRLTYSMLLIDTGQLHSAKPHHALHDAIALMQWCEQNKGTGR